MLSITTKIVPITLLLGVLVAGCGRFEVSINRADEPRAVTPAEPVAATGTPLPVALPEGPTTVPTIAAPIAVTATPLGAAPTAPIPLGATYVDHFAGIAMEYPAGWEVYELDAGQKASASTYATTFQSWVSGPGGGGGTPDGATKIDLVVYPNRGGTLDKAVTLRRAEIESPGSEMTLLSEEPVRLASGLEGVRIRTSSMFGEASEIVTAANGHLIIFSGSGDGAQLNQILQTLHPVDTDAAVLEPTAPAPSATDVRAIRIVDGVRAATVVSGPGEGGSPVAQIPGGMTVAVSGISDDGGWYQLAGCGEQNPYRPAPDCWVSADGSVAQPVRPMAPSQQPVRETDTTAVLVVTQNMANVRGGPGMDYPVISQLAGGFSFPVIGVSEDGEWWRLAECSSPLNEVLSECWISADPGVTEATSAEAMGGPRPTALPPTALPSAEVPQRAGTITITLTELPKCVNLDNGAVEDRVGGDSNPLCEFTLRGADSAGTLLFEPIQPARFGFGGVFPEAPSVSMCTGSQHLSGGSETIAPLATLYVCYQTGEGRFGYLHFVDMTDDPLAVTMEWETFE